MKHQPTPLLTAKPAIVGAIESMGDPEVCYRMRQKCAQSALQDIQLYELAQGLGVNLPVIDRLLDSVRSKVETAYHFSLAGNRLSDALDNMESTSNAQDHL